MTDINFAPFGLELELPVFWAVAWGIVWLISLGRILGRGDFDDRKRIVWLLAVIFIPVFGVVFYLFLSSPASAARARESRMEPLKCFECDQLLPPGAVECRACGWSYSGSPAEPRRDR